ncbi:DUF4268 domain-containing protein [Methanococcus maripaludis]|uniref:DUF4268 domain-containing protein n=1 Tax=Methanococcus maripaludis TaxID=39152 RepID=A0A7J9PTG7_METMI|nr:DUF4268 domain-containing protein [Methanococcus maripaludis]MBA2868871.1 hypothetical protein [Methanococcus maripaludis]
MTRDLGKLEKVRLRDIWKHEALDFTTWLSKDENIQNLSEEIGIEIKVLETEASVGNFNVDILAEDPDCDRKIIIENQLEKTDHDHLGKLITYASGHNAEIIIWIVEKAREEHKRAIEWLNENIDEKINFFLIQLEVWRIGESMPAPKFQIISRPNDWAKTIKHASDSGRLTNVKALQLEFWESFKEYVEDKGLNFKLRKPRPQHWYDISYGNSSSHLTVTVDTRTSAINCMMYIEDNMDLYYKFHDHKEEIEKELGFSLEWAELPGKKASKMYITRNNINFENKTAWKNYFGWITGKLELLRDVFTKYL